jgi:hypothetical protein
MPTKTTPSADFLKVAEAETEKSYQEHQQRCEI